MQWKPFALESVGYRKKLIKEGNHKDESHAPQNHDLDLKHLTRSFVCLSSDVKLRACHLFF